MPSSTLNIGDVLTEYPEWADEARNFRSQQLSEESSETTEVRMTAEDLVTHFRQSALRVSDLNKASNRELQPALDALNALHATCLSVNRDLSQSMAVRGALLQVCNAADTLINDAPGSAASRLLDTVKVVKKLTKSTSRTEGSKGLGLANALRSIANQLTSTSQEADTLQ